MGDLLRLNPAHHELMREIARVGGRDLALRVDEYVGQLLAAYQVQEPAACSMTTGQIAAVDAAAVEVQIKAQELRVLIERIHSQTG
jgi:hypothetical protein